jgi:flagellar hook-basal body complex protein FliE
MPIESIGALSGLPAVAPTSPTSAALPTAVVSPPLPGTAGIDPTSSADAVSGAQSADFGTALAGQVDALQAMQGERDTLSLQAVTGDLQDIHEATIAAAEASATMDLMVALRNTSLQAFNELMRIQA